MKTTAKKLACLGISLLCLTGCATSRSKPMSLAEKVQEQKLNELRFLCQGLRQGSYVNIKFAQGSVDSTGKTMNGNLVGYVYGFNRMNDTLSVSVTPLTFLNRGELYFLKDIESIEPMQQTAMANEPPNIIIKAVQNFINVDKHDPERELLTQ